VCGRLCVAPEAVLIGLSAANALKAGCVGVVHKCVIKQQPVACAATWMLERKLAHGQAGPQALLCCHVVLSALCQPG
jgi:hypothetical protein